MGEILTIIYVVGVVLLLFGAAIFVHEFGHFWVALKRGLKVEEFAIGFGPVVWSREKDGILYSIRLIPAGGFVKLPQMLTSEAIEGKAKDDDENSEDDDEDDEPEEELPPVSPLSKILVAFAGPIMNIIFAIIIAVFLWIVGIPKQVNEPVIGYVGKNSAEFTAGARPGDRIGSINGEPIESWQDVVYAVLDSTGDTVEVGMVRGEEKMTLKLPADTWDGGIRRIRLDNHERMVIDSIQKDSLFADVGFESGDSVEQVNGAKVHSQYHFVDLLMESPGEEKSVAVRRNGKLVTLKFSTPERAGVSVGMMPVPEHGTWDLILSKLGKDLEPIEDTAAMKAGIKKGDVIHRVNGQRITSTRHLIDVIQANGDKEMQIELIRGDENKTLAATPKDKRLGIGLEHELGLLFQPAVIRYGEKLSHPNPVEQFGDVLYKVGITFKALGRSSESGVGAKDLSGPIGIFGMLAIQVKHDLRLALSFLVLLNINLAILNLLPVPVLDGGHILMSCIEWIRKKPVSVRLQEYATTAFAILLISFFLYVTFADVKRVPLLHDIFKRDTQIEQTAPGD